MRSRRIRLHGYWLVLALALGCGSAAGWSQPKDKAAPQASSPGTQAVNQEYTAKIKEYTTEKYFLTELVDHLPASNTAPSPDKILGYIAGAPDHLTYSKDIYRYMRALEKASPRVKVFQIGTSDEGREVLAVAVSDEANLAKLDRIKEINARLADPRTIKGDAEAAALEAETKPIYWMTGSIHSSETGSPEMLMELAYRLAVEETPFIRNIRKNVIALITPITEVDGHDRMVDLYRYRKNNPKKQAPGLIYWGDYVAHDNNRDGMTLSLRLSQVMMKNFLDFHPLVMHDLHESVPFLYTSTGAGPYNAWLDPIVIDEWQELAYYEVEGFAKRQVPGIWTQGYYDGWAPNYMFFIANNHNAIGRFYETFGNGGADTRIRTVSPSQASRTWYRPNPPLAKVNWSLRNNINLQQTGVLLAMDYVAHNGDRLLQNFYLKGKRAIAKATSEGPAAYVIPADEKRPFDAADLVNLLRRQGCEVQVASETIETKDGTFAPGSYVIRMDQPYSRIADMLLDKQYYSPDEVRPYDDTGWTLGALKDVKTVRVKDPAILKGSMTLLTAAAKPEGGIQGQGAVYAVPDTADNNLILLRFRLPEAKMLAAEEEFESGGRKFGRGSFLIEAAGAQNGLGAACKDLGIKAYGLDAMPEVPTHELAVPRMAILHNWVSTQDEGWFRLAFDTLGVPYSYISDLDVGKTTDLRSKYDVIIFPPSRGSAQRLVNGLPMTGDPIPWKATEEYPNMTGPKGAQTDDIRGGMGLEGVLNLERFVKAGGLLVTITGVSSLPLDYGLVEGISISQPSRLNVRGSVLKSVVADKKSPVTYGYGDDLDLYFSSGPIFNVGGGRMFGRRGGGRSQGRVTGRGSLDDPDVVQGRPSYPAPEGREDRNRGYGGFGGASGADRPRVLLRWAPAKELLVSGLLEGGEELAGKPAVVDAPLGKGHILMFANNPFWRMETSGSYMLLFNAAMNYNHLSAGAEGDTETSHARR